MLLVVHKSSSGKESNLHTSFRTVILYAYKLQAVFSLTSTADLTLLERVIERSEFTGVLQRTVIHGFLIIHQIFGINSMLIYIKLYFWDCQKVKHFTVPWGVHWLDTGRVPSMVQLLYLFGMGTYVAFLPSKRYTKLPWGPIISPGGYINIHCTMGDSYKLLLDPYIWQCWLGNTL